MNCGHGPDSHRYVGEEDSDQPSTADDEGDETNLERTRNVPLDSIQLILHSYSDLILVNLMEQCFLNESKGTLRLSSNRLELTCSKQ